MKRLDPAVNSLSSEDLRSLLFSQGSDLRRMELEHMTPLTPTREVQVGSLAVHRNFTKLLRRFPIKHRKMCIITTPLQHPDTLRPNVAKARRYMTHYPYGSMCLAAAVHKFVPGWQVDIIDLNNESLLRAVDGLPHDFESIMKLVPDDYDIYGITWMFVSSEASTLQVMRYLKDRGKLVITGGQQSSGDWVKLLEEDYVHIVAKREGELTLCRMLSWWSEIDQGGDNPPEDARSIANLSYKLDDDLHSFPEKFDNPLGLDIREEYRKLNIADYNRSGAPSSWVRILAKDRPFANVLFTRGCRGKCAFCQVIGFMGHGVRTRSVDDVIDEIEFLYHQKGVRHIEWVDDDLLGDGPRVVEMLHRIAALDLDLTFSTANAVIAAFITEEIAQGMADAKFVHTGFGIETGNKKRLKTLGKPASLETIQRACNIFKQKHKQIWVHGNFMLGYPEETHQEMNDTLNFARGLGIDWCACAILQPLVNTPFYNDFMNLGDGRVVERFGKNAGASVASPGRDAVYKGRTFDDRFESVIDFRTIDPEKQATELEIQQFHIYFTVNANLLGNVNLTTQGFPDRIQSLTADTLKTYPFDAVSWGVHAKASLMLGQHQRFEESREQCKQAVARSWFWSEFFELYDVHRQLGILRV